ncbi:MAG: hypothetical protein IM581_10355 [Chitinophagaceae bacterium]|jgi:hypothetical protein|nr:hypothetical protein [Chitinophagaceae bacterium]
MTLSEFKKHLSVVKELNFLQPNGEFVPLHFHITEVGLITKNFLDCGGDVHTDKLANLQIWVADDVHHRLEPNGLLKIIELSNKVLGNEDLEIEVEYQTETIGKYKIEKQGVNFVLVSKQTDCLAKIRCNIPQSKQKIKLGVLTSVNESCCTPGSGCC